MEAIHCTGCGHVLATQGAPCLACSGVSATGNRAMDMADALRRRPPQLPEHLRARAKPRGPRWPHVLAMFAVGVLLALGLASLRGGWSSGWQAMLDVAAVAALLPALLGSLLLLSRWRWLAWLGFGVALCIALLLQWGHQVLSDAGAPADVVGAVAGPDRSDAKIRQELALAYQDAMAENNARNAGFQQRHNELKLDKLLSAKNLTSRQGIQRGRAKIKAFRELGQEQVASMRQVATGMDQWVEQNVPVRPGWQSFWSDYRMGMRAREDRYEQVLDVQRRSTQELQGLFDLMEENLGRVDVQGDQLVFRDEATLRQFNATLAYLDRLAQEEAMLQREAESASRRINLELDQMAAPAP